MNKNQPVQESTPEEEKTHANQSLLYSLWKNVTHPHRDQPKGSDAAEAKEPHPAPQDAPAASVPSKVKVNKKELVQAINQAQTTEAGQKFIYQLLKNLSQVDDASGEAVSEEALEEDVHTMQQELLDSLHATEKTKEGKNLLYNMWQSVDQIDRKKHGKHRKEEKEQELVQALHQLQESEEGGKLLFNMWSRAKKISKKKKTGDTSDEMDPEVSQEEFKKQQKKLLKALRAAEKTEEGKQFLYHLYQGISGVQPVQQEGEDASNDAQEPAKPARQHARAPKPFPKGEALPQLFETWRSECQAEPLIGFGPEDLMPVGEPLTEDGRALIREAEAMAKGILEQFHGTEETGLQPANGKFCTRITSNRLRAMILLLPPLNDGKPVTREEVEQSLAEQKITFGIDAAVLDRIFGDTTLYFQILDVAKGTPPVPGMDGYIEEIVPRSESFRLIEKDDGVVDFRDMNWFHHIKEGEVLCKIHPPGEPKSGMDIFGNEVPGEPGKKVTAPAGRNTVLSEDGTELLAKVDGQVLIQGSNYLVEQTMTINGNVDFSVGNLDVSGNIMVQGDVCGGFTVKASGDITINGMVEGATVIAGGSIFIRSGMNGGAKGRLSAGKDIKCKFLENCVAEAHGDIYVESSVNAKVYSWGSVLIKSGKGFVIGGEVSAMKTLEANAVGSKLNLATSVSLCIQESFLEERGRLVKESTKLEMQMQGDGENKPSQAILGLKLRDIQTKLEHMREMEEEVKKAVMRFGVVYPNTSIAIGSSRCLVMELKNACMIYQKQGQLVFGAK